MAAYVIADIKIQDSGPYEEYRKRVPATIEKFGGRYLARGGAVEVMEGDWQPSRVVILEFPDMDALRRWYHSEEYRNGVIQLRQSASEGSIIAVEGL
ncbi:MAG: DUF1330 domain-containing protein [Rhodospirillales bacterium]|nr:DUF1330 domain-containing protein [Rhodospirillales bacterium]